MDKTGLSIQEGHPMNEELKLKTAEEYAEQFVIALRIAPNYKCELTELIRQVQQDSKDEWIEKCADMIRAQTAHVGANDTETRIESVYNEAVYECLKAILSLKTEHPDIIAKKE